MRLTTMQVRLRSIPCARRSYMLYWYSIILCDERSSAVRAQVRFGDVWVSSYDIEWTPTSYPSRRPKDTAELPFPNQSQSNQVNYSYSLIELNTHKLKRLRHDPWMGVYRGVP